MTQASSPAHAFDGLASLRQMLQLLASIRNLAQPLSSAEGLQQALTSLVQLAGLLGVDSQWTARLQSILQDPAVFNVVLSVVQYVLGTSASPPASTVSSPAPVQAQAVTLDAQTLSLWLPLIVQLIGLIRQIRGEQ